MGAGDTDKFSYSTGVSNLTMSVEVITFTSSLVAQGSDKQCRLCKVMSQGVVTMGETAVVAASGALLLTDDYTTLPVANTNMLHFKGVEGEKVYIISFL